MNTQAKFIAEYNDKNRPKFNDKFFNKSDDDIIEDLKDVILSCERNKFYTIKVLNFEVIDDYNEVQKLLIGDETPSISIKDSDLKILKVTYHVACTKDEDTFDVLIAIPRVIDGAYIHLNGNDYFPLFQLVDGSTYNNTTASSAKTQSITLKTNSNAVKMLRNFIDLNTTNEETVRAAMFSVYLFDHKVTLFEYYLARFGWYETLDKFNFEDVIKISDHDLNDPEYYTFAIANAHMKTPFYISAVKSFMDNDRILQSFVASFARAISLYATKKTTLDQIYTTEFWICKLGYNFVSSETSVFTKGNAIIESLENSYDIPTKKRLRLPDHVKEDIYSVLKWMACEFSSIRLKNNLDASSKRIRWSEYIAAMYIMLINVKLRRLPEKHDPNMEAYRIKRNVRAIDPSHLGIIDLNTSSASDPGVGGMLCPLNYGVYEWNSFTNEEEPNVWDENFSKMLNIYREEKGYTSAIMLADDAGLELTDTRDPAAVAFDADLLSQTIAKVARTRAFEKQLRPALINMEDSCSIYFEEV